MPLEAPALAPAALAEIPQPTAAADAISCPHTGLACPALSRLFGGQPQTGESARDWALKLAPCESCRVSFESQRAQLRRLRLGQREREVLLGAARFGTYTVTEAGMSRSLSAARRRAAQSLIRSGLVTKAIEPQTSLPTSEFRHPRAAVALTPLGRYVMGAFGRFIEGGKPVRWTRPARGVPLPGKAPTDLLEETLANARSLLIATLGDLKRALVAALSPVRDRAALDTVTRHLESKVQGLKDLLEGRA